MRLDSIPKAGDSSAVDLTRFLLAIVGTGAGAVSGGYLGATKPSHRNAFCTPGSVLLGVVAGGPGGDSGRHSGRGAELWLRRRSPADSRTCRRRNDGAVRVQISLTTT